SGPAYCYIFGPEDLYKDFKSQGQQFYKHVRCGILHQGETTGGWQITRDDAEPLFDSGTLTVNETKFHTLMANVIDKYQGDLKANPLSADIWKHFTVKMKATIKNCEI
ncbi:MAG: hypothetical protein ACRD4H_13945, partial [Candidatus Acidiferrales bacterium]